MNPFEKHGINWLSPSSLNTYLAEPAFWAAKYLFAVSDEVGPAAKRGTAVEAGLDVSLYGAGADEATAAALNNFALNTNGLADDDHEAERAAIPPMLIQAREALKGLPKPNARQVRIEYRVDGIEVPIIGYADYVWDEYGLDLKTTKRLPSSPSADHVRQIAVYQAAKQKSFSLLYVTDKKHIIHKPDQASIDEALKSIAQIARAVRAVLSRSDCREEVLSLFAPRYDDFRWSDTTIAETAKIYASAGLVPPLKRSA